MQYMPNTLLPYTDRLKSKATGNHKSYGTTRSRPLLPATTMPQRIRRPRLKIANVKKQPRGPNRESNGNRNFFVMSKVAPVARTRAKKI